MPRWSSSPRQVAIQLAAATLWFVAGGCAEDGSIYGEANRAVDAANAVLVARGVCASASACRDRALVRFEAGRGVAWINVHTALDSGVVREIADSCRRIARTDARRAPIQLSVEGEVGRPGIVHNWQRRFEPE